MILAKRGLPKYQVDGLIKSTLCPGWQSAYVTDHVRKVTSRSPKPFETWAGPRAFRLSLIPPVSACLV